jgi:hypothetical protein
MEAIAHNPSFAKKVGVKQSVGKDFSAADKGKKFKGGGEMKEESKAMVKKEIGFMKKKSAPKSMVKHEESEMAGMKKGGMPMKKMAAGGMTSMGKVKTGAPSRDGIAERGKTKGKNLGDSGKTVGIQSGARRGK